MNRYVNEFSKGLIRENPVSRLVLGTCPTLAVTTAAMNGLGMGAAATFVLVCSNIVISLLAARMIPDKGAAARPSWSSRVHHRPAAGEGVPAIHRQGAGDLSALIVVNCIILGRAEAFASATAWGLSALDGLGMGAGFTGALVVMGYPRVSRQQGLFSAGRREGFSPPSPFFVLPAGGFFVFGILIWLTNQLSHKFDKDTAREELSGQVCAACPMTGTCHGAEGCKPASSAANRTATGRGTRAMPNGSLLAIPHRRPAGKQFRPLPISRHLPLSGRVQKS